MWVRSNIMNKALESIAVRILAAVTLAALLTGCGNDSVPTGVESFDSGIESGATSYAGGASSRWTLLASVAVDPSSGPVSIAGGRYALDLPAGAVSGPVVITLCENPAGEFEFEFGPVGLALVEPGMVEVDFSGTALDPASRDYQGDQPYLWSIDAEGELVDPIPGSYSHETCTFVAPIDQLGRFRLLAVQGGTAGWD